MWWLVSEVTLTTMDEGGNRQIRRWETNLGDLCADAFRVVLGTNVALMNGGGIRADIAAGEVTMGDILSVYAFGNEGCMVRVTGQQLLDALVSGVRYYLEETGAFLHVSGLTFSFNPSIPSRVITNDHGEFVRVEGTCWVRDVMIGGASWIRRPPTPWPAITIC